MEESKVTGENETTNDVEIINAALRVIHLAHDCRVDSYQTEGAVKAAWEAIANCLSKYKAGRGKDE